MWFRGVVGCRVTAPVGVASVVGVLEQRELTACRRMDELREEVDRLQAELMVAEQKWKEFSGRTGAFRSNGREAKAQVPMWSEGLASSVLPLDYQRIITALANAVPAKVEALRYKAKRLVACGWLAEPVPGRFTFASGVSGPGGGA